MGKGARSPRKQVQYCKVYVWALLRSHMAQTMQKSYESVKERRKLMIEIATLVKDDRGQDLIEYALLGGLISLVSLFAIINVGSGVNGVWVGVDSRLAGIPTP